MLKSVESTTLNLINWNICDVYNSSGIDVLFVVVIVVILYYILLCCVKKRSRCACV